MAHVTLSHRHDWVPTPGCLVSQPPRLLTIPEPPQRRWWEGDTAVPVCVGGLTAHCRGAPGGRGAWRGSPLGGAWPGICIRLRKGGGRRVLGPVAPPPLPV